MSPVSPSAVLYCLDACDYRSGVVGALFHRVPVQLAPEAFGFKGKGVSYETQVARPLDWFRSDDGVTIRRVGKGEPDTAFALVDLSGQNLGGFDVEIGTGDWLEYAIHVRMPARLAIEVDVRPADSAHHRPPTVQIDGEALATTLRGGWVSGTTADVVPEGRHLVRIGGRCPATEIRSLVIAPSLEPS